jgi:hypothetical protein
LIPPFCSLSLRETAGKSPGAGYNSVIIIDIFINLCYNKYIKEREVNKMYRVKILDRFTDEELSSHWVGIEDLTDFIFKYSTRKTKIVILNEYFN